MEEEKIATWKGVADSRLPNEFLRQVTTAVNELLPGYLERQQVFAEGQEGYNALDLEGVSIFAEVKAPSPTCAVTSIAEKATMRKAEGEQMVGRAKINRLSKTIFTASDRQTLATQISATTGRPISEDDVDYCRRLLWAFEDYEVRRPIMETALGWQAKLKEFSARKETTLGDIVQHIERYATALDKVHGGTKVSDAERVNSLKILTRSVYGDAGCTEYDYARDTLSNRALPHSFSGIVTIMLERLREKRTRAFDTPAVVVREMQEQQLHLMQEMVLKIEKLSKKRGREETTSDAKDKKETAPRNPASRDWKARPFPKETDGPEVWLPDAVCNFHFKSDVKVTDEARMHTNASCRVNEKPEFKKALEKWRKAQKK